MLLPSYLYRYPKGKYCTFLMPISNLLYQLNKTRFPIQLYIIDDSCHAALKVTSRGFCKDQRLLDSLVNLTTTRMNNHQINGKLFYNRTIVIPVFEESKYPIGSITLKITAKIMHKHNCPIDSLNNQCLTPLEHCIPTKENQANEKARNAAENVSNMWFPPPLCYTSKIIPADDTTSLTCEEVNLQDFIEHSDTHGYNNSSIDIQHKTSVLTDHNSGYVPSKRATTNSDEQSKKSTSDTETKPVCKHEETIRTVCLQEYPCLSAMYKELTLLHSNTRERKNQFVQTDQVCDKDNTSNHENNGNISHLENTKVNTEKTSISASCIAKQGDEIIPPSRSSNKQALSDSLSLCELPILSDNNSLSSTSSHVSQSSSSISLKKTTSNVEPSTPSVMITVSQPNNITSNITKQDFITHSSPNLHQLLRHDSTTVESPTSGSLVNLKIPQHSVESTLTLGGTASNEVKCGNTSLGQKIYLASSLQSIGTGSRHENKENDAVSSSDEASLESFEVTDQSPQESVANTSNSEIQEIINNEDSSEFEYSDDFESDSN